jgi:superfamily II DNA or RNA helicase
MISRGGFIVKKETLSKEEQNKLKNSLTVSPELQNAGFVNVNESFPVFRESESRFRIPRFYGVEHFGTPKHNKIPNGISIDVPFQGVLKASTFQDVASDKVISHLHDCGGGILSLPTGYGKTCVSLYILSKMKVKTLIIVHKEFLMNQWRERIQQFLPSAKIGIIQKNKIDILGKDVVIGMLQSLAMKDYSPNTFDSFGLTIIDETHHISSKVFSKALFAVCTKYMLGLSATPIRKDGLTKVLNWFIGDIIFSVQRENQSAVNVNIKHFSCDEFNKDPPLNKLGKISLSTLINDLVVIPERNQLIVELLACDIREGRKIIVLSDRRNHCEILLELVRAQIPECTVGLYMGGMKQSELDKSEKCDILLATFSLAHEGLDIPSLDTLILATPKTDIVQSCGRILRETVGKKNTPLIHDILDRFASLPAQAMKRRKYYKEAGFIINGGTKLTKNSVKQVGSYSFIDE